MIPKHIADIIAERKKWLKEIETQDNRCTQRPIIVALQLAREYPARDGYSHDGEWTEDPDTGPLEEAIPYKIHWEDEQHFFTYSACEEHLRMNKHNYPKHRDFVKYAFRNREWAEIPKDIKTLIEYIEEMHD